MIKNVCSTEIKLEELMLIFELFDLFNLKFSILESDINNLISIIKSKLNQLNQ